ncbi:hypothetical protein KR044_008206, partial [Drosophila immigrans]
MEWYEIELDGGRTCQFREYLIPGYAEHQLTKPHNERGLSADYIGGIINGGKWGWLTRRRGADSDSSLLICWLTSGELVALHTFGRGNKEKCSIRCVEELLPEAPGNERVLLAVCLESNHRTNVAIYTPSSSQVLRYIELQSLGSPVRCMSYFGKSTCILSALHDFDGCLAVGLEAGRVLLIDLNVEEIIERRERNIFRPDKELLRAQVHVGQMPQMTRETVNELLPECRLDDTHLAIDLALAGTSSICCLLPLECITGFAAGLQDGGILIYNLNVNCVIATLRLPANEPAVSVERLCCILPPDDPKPSFYICAVYKQADQQLMATLHVLNFRRCVPMANKQNYLLRDFQCASPRLRLLLDEKPSSLLGCCSLASYEDAKQGSRTLLTVISWHSHSEAKNKFIVFDINQWYRDELPSQPSRCHERPNYLCGFVLSGLYTGLALHMDASSIVHFVSLPRHDAHFYPNALSFECALLTINGCRRYAHVGVQRRFLGAMCSQRARVFLNPEPFQQEIMALRLMPQFSDHNLQSNGKLSKRNMYELILSVALEHNRMELLKSCVQSCLDGSFMCNMLSSTKLSLSIFSHWLLQRAVQIKERCSELCQGIFEYDAYTLDERECEEFQELNLQLMRLHQLQQHILQVGKSRLGPELLQDVESTAQGLGVLYEFQRVLYWLIECQLLPDNKESPSPLPQIRLEYEERRRLHQHRLYIDELLQQQQQQHQQSQLPLDSTVYPPESLQTLMQMLLLLPPEAQLQHKQQLLLYLLLDWDAARNCSQLFDNYVLSFNIEKSLVRCVRSFWLLDRGQYAAAVEELYRGGSQSTNYAGWEAQLLLESLLAGGAAKEAMQVAAMPPGTISSQLQLRVLLANNDIPQAFHHARLAEDERGRPLLEYFFEHCIRRGMFKVLGSLCLREHEEQLVSRLLHQCNSRKTDSVQLILLLKRCKYIEAVSFMDDVAAQRRRSSTLGDNHDETSTLLSAYRTTMAPVTQSLAGTYFRIRDRLNGRQLASDVAPEPFSCQLAKQNVNGELGGIFQSSALSAHWATLSHANERPLDTHNMPFLRNVAAAAAASQRNQQLQRRRLVRPTPYQYVEKRSLETHQRQSTLQLAKRRCTGLQHQQLQQLEQDEQEELPLLDSQQLQALLQPPAYLQLKRSPLKPEKQQPLPLPTRPIIVNHRQASPLPLPQPQPETAVVTERRSFSFQPPLQLSERQPSVQPEEQQLDEEEEDEEEEASDVLFMEIESEAASDSEYLSPLPSANVSLVQPQPEVERPLATPTGPQSRSSLHQPQAQGSSGFGSFTSTSTSSVIGGISSLLNNFVPPVCSSKMCELQLTAASVSHVKLSERTTICGDIEEPSTMVISPTPTPPVSVWATPATAPPGAVRLLDTTLGMSSYDVTEQVAPQTQLETIELDDDDEDNAQTVSDAVEEVEDEEEEEQDQDQDQKHSSPSRSPSRSASSSRSSSEQDTALDYNQASPSYSISSELSDDAAAVARQAAPVYSIVVESTTNSITNSRSRSPTSHTPTSFLPSDTNVSQNSSPRAAHVGAGDGTLYRANSLETVDDLDTTKGSLEEDDDVDEEDECVIALDGTEVRGYVARPETLPACSSAELFAFKQSDDAAGSAGQAQGSGREEAAGCPSLGATANSDSLQAYTINLDSSEGLLADPDVDNNNSQD